jgi:hypothetical protein
VSQRPGFIVDERRGTQHGGISPNAFMPYITVQVRLHAPPLCTRSEVVAALSEAYMEALDKIEEGPWRGRAS